MKCPSQAVRPTRLSSIKAMSSNLAVNCVIEGCEEPVATVCVHCGPKFCIEHTPADLMCPCLYHLWQFHPMLNEQSSAAHQTPEPIIVDPITKDAAVQCTIIVQTDDLHPLNSEIIEITE